MRESSVQFGRTAVQFSSHSIKQRTGRRTVIALATACGLLALWAGGVTTYLVLKDDLAAGLIRRQVDQQHAYEQKIAALRLQVDRMVGRQLLDQDSVEAQVAELLSRQAAIENRHVLIARLAEDIGAQPKPPELAMRRTAPVAPSDTISPGLSYAPDKPTPIVEFPIAVEPRGLQGAAQPAAAKPLPERVSSLRRALGAIGDSQAAALRGLEAQADRASARLRAALADVGLEPAKLTPRMPAAMGGPLVPIDAATDIDEFARAADRVRFTVKSLVTLRGIAAAMPVRRPLPGAELTSGFGQRADPFTRGPAMHTGFDFRAPAGAPIKAPGAGIVVIADVRGGYGKMVEIDHGYGLTTRYAHMSAIHVEEGQKIAVGQVIGLVGSTGRSTGPHLHYETRVRGEASDPLHFLEVGRRHRGVF